MASYEQEHDLAEARQAVLHDDANPRAETIRHLAEIFGFMRDLLGSGGADFAAHGERPPTSKEFVKNLAVHVYKKGRQSERCPVCTADFEDQEECHRLPCQHLFHTSCILPWLEKVCTCPVCRHELPTDDAVYEERKRFKADEKSRLAQLERLHDSMFG
eukprot:m.187566 g.187566  ORF g.187566 m.187566 type:complete len:159 (+) comp17524_c0_seq1:3677-4153(+)